MSEFYEFTINDNPEQQRTEYWFTTGNGLSYYAYIVAAPEFLEEFAPYEYLNEFGYVIGFCPLEEDLQENSSHDCMIGPTICNIILDFTSRLEKSIIIFHCDPSDGLQRARKITFSKWFNKHDGIRPIHKGNVEMEIHHQDGSSRKEYLGYFAFCPEEEIPLADAEFREFAKEKALNGKQIA